MISNDFPSNLQLQLKITNFGFLIKWHFISDLVDSIPGKKKQSEFVITCYFEND